MITEYHCTFVKRNKIVGKYILSHVPRECDTVRINNELYIVDSVTWDFDSQVGNTVSVVVFVK